MQLDIIIRHATIIDGTNAPAYSADVGIENDKIAFIGDLSRVQAPTDIDAQSKVLAPGFIDVHTHDDTNVIRLPECLPKISQGITTTIVGNCGISASPATLTAAPPDPMNLLGKQTDFQYPTFASYAKAVTNAEPAVNVAALVGHTTLRNNVMDDLFTGATNEQIAQMRKTLREALEQGALGLSSGLAYASAKSSPEEEVQQLAMELSEFGGIYTTHMRTEFEGILGAMDEAFRVGQKAKVPVIISHLKCAGAGNWGRTHDVLKKMDSASAHQDIACDCYPYSASSSTLDLKQVTDDIDIFITWSDSLPEHAGKLLKQVAQDMDLPLMDAAQALQPAGAVYHCMDEADVERVLKYKLTMIGSDGLPNDPHPHPRLWGAFPRVLGYYSRERNIFSLETAIHKMTGLSAARFQLAGRGEIKTGNFADLVLFDKNEISDVASYDHPIAAAKGILAVIVNGNIAYTEKQGVLSRSGRFLARSIK
ncbi:D-aminoacylase [Enterovibrio sp. ZSDZ42]|uniref:D-aminoacylase n=1 Tax=Enterovibrio gelatinilyticus TaxID=2899819 RepID=A0ABT5R5A2_9GAMM|nr:D-aminoacylase [Enterovibrio sp. ZSDZ42]MDD1795452.1 D-aminoacylase [Enterovibrio sp. ZSDZ42]